MLPLSLIAALADNNVIGINNKLPWHLPADLKHFKAITSGKPVIMGRRTWQSIDRALPNRLNIVVSKQLNFNADGAEVYSSLEKAILRANNWAHQQQVSELMLIGGAQIYQEALAKQLVSKLYLTRVHLSPKGDAYFPKFNREEWQKIASTDFAVEGDKPAYTFENWVR